MSIVGDIFLLLDDFDCLDFLGHVNSLFSVYDEVEIRSHLPNLSEIMIDVAWYASFNMIFAIGSLFHLMAERNDVGLFIDPADPKFARSWGFFGNCCSVLPGLLLQDTNLTGLAAIVTMVSCPEIQSSGSSPFTGSYDHTD